MYLVILFAGGALLAPQLYRLAAWGAEYSPAISRLAANPFARFVNRSMLILAVLGIWPLLKSCGMATGESLGLRASPRRAATSLGRGFLLGFGSLALIAVLALALHGRTFNSEQPIAQILRHLGGAALSALIVAVMEEIIFRGTLFGILRQAISWPRALIISSAIYALVHFLQNAKGPAAIEWHSGLVLLPKMFLSGMPFIPAALTLFVAGAILALMYQRTGALYFSMGLHAGWIFWLKSYGSLTQSTSARASLLWGSDKLIDGWGALPVLILVWCLLSRRRASEIPV